MIITVDANNDAVYIHEDELGPDSYEAKGIVVFNKIRDAIRVKSLLEEIFTKIYENMRTCDIDVRLDYIDEDKSTTVGEW